MRIILILISILVLAGCTPKLQTCDLIDAKNPEAKHFVEFMNSLNSQEQLELKTKLSEVENSIKGQRAYESKECPDSFEDVVFEINNVEYKIVYNQINFYKFYLTLETNGEIYYYSRNY